MRTVHPENEALAREAARTAIQSNPKLGAMDAEAIKAALLAQVSTGAVLRNSLTEVASELIEAFAAIDVATSVPPAGGQAA